VALIRAGLLDLDHFAATAFPLEQVDQAVAHAAANAGPFLMTLLRP
jgi:alcohol dehydrogenase